MTIVLEHRDLDETLALTTARHLRHLEQLVVQMRKQAPYQFRLAGSAVAEVWDLRDKVRLASWRTTGGVTAITGQLSVPSVGSAFTRIGANLEDQR